MRYDRQERDRTTGNGPAVREDALHREYAAGSDDPQYRADALERARRRLGAVRAHATDLGAPLGHLPGRVLLACAFFAAPSFAILYAAWFVWTRGGSARWYAGALLALGVLLPALAGQTIRNAKADTPERALSIFFDSLAARKRRALRLVLPSDVDGFPRFPPTDPLGAFRFAEDGQFAAYWRAVLGHVWLPYSLTSVRGLSVHVVDAEVVVASFRLKLEVRSWLALALAPLGHVVAGILDHVSCRILDVEIRKILVRVDGEWHLFDGALQGPEEEDSSWLGPAAPES